MVAENYQRKQEILLIWQPDRRAKKCPAKLPTKPLTLSQTLKLEQDNGFTTIMSKIVKSISDFNQAELAKTEA